MKNTQNWTAAGFFYVVGTIVAAIAALALITGLFLGAWNNVIFGGHCTVTTTTHANVVTIVRVCPRQ